MRANFSKFRAKEIDKRDLQIKKLNESYSKDIQKQEKQFRKHSNDLEQNLASFITVSSIIIRLVELCTLSIFDTLQKINTKVFQDTLCIISNCGLRRKFI